MKEKFYSLLEDHIFKQVFGDRKNTSKLALLLESLLPLEGDELSTLKIENTFIERSWREDKLVVLDVNASTKSGKVFDAEVQIEKSGFFHNRLVYYLCRLITEQLRKGHKYDKIRPAYCIAICNFAFLPSLPGYIHRFELREGKSGALFTDLLNIVIIELPKMPKENDGSEAWPILKCFRCKTGEEAEMHAKAYPKVREIVAELREFSLTREIRSAYNMYQKAWRDREMWKDEYHARGMEEGRKEGLEQGREQGREQGLEQGAAQERKKWESENEALQSEVEALRRELERARGA
ncbi:MAG: Rpn family recombination-promoting nuclease/putative transposase [Spirochaetaceae bacterium]|nr:Rpn family recombination-promoting nuclease/putative transposase [Spirochaetaceae bacterium]